MSESLTRYLEALDTPSSGAWALVGVPYDDTASFKKGARKGPQAIRDASDNLEDYCPVADRSLIGSGLADVGDVPVERGMGDAVHARIRTAYEGLLASGARPLLLGGEHSVSIEPIRLMAARHPDLCVVQFDAHADLRTAYSGTPNSHACVMRRALDVITPDRLFQIGIRSGTAEEWAFMRQNGTVYAPTAATVAEIVAKIGQRPVYLTLDLDVLDPSIMSGTGTPEPGGIDYATLSAHLTQFAKTNLVAADIVELAPELDPSGVSSVVAAKLVRTLVLQSR